MFTYFNSLFAYDANYPSSVIGISLLSMIGLPFWALAGFGQFMEADCSDMIFGGLFALFFLALGGFAIWVSYHEVKDYTQDSEETEDYIQENEETRDHTQDSEENE